MTQTTPGWYPQEDGRQRYWDGQVWTEHYAPGPHGPADQATRSATPPAPGATAADSVPPSAAPTPAGKRNWFSRHKVLSGLGALIVIIIIASAAGSGGDGPAQASNDDSAPVAGSSANGQSGSKGNAEAKKANTAGLNAAVRDGKFEFTVKKLTCGKATIGGGALSTKAQGQFCLLSMHVKNIGKESQLLDSSSQYAFDATGRKFDADGAAAIYLGDANTFLKEINPGNAIDGTLVFDIPKNAKITKVELHDSPFSGGVTVQVK